MDANENKEEVIEELSDFEIIQPSNETPIKDDITPDKKIDDVINSSNSDNAVSSENDDNVDLNEPVVLENNNSVEKTTEDGEKTESETVEQSIDEIKKKSKMPLIILLSILLVIDIAALVIYIIGLDKVLGFIK